MANEKSQMDPIEQIKQDIRVSIDGPALIKSLVKVTRGDHRAYDILKECYQDKYWGDSQLELIEKTGEQNRYNSQL